MRDAVLALAAGHLGRTFTALQIRVLRGEEILLDLAAGSLGEEDSERCGPAALFDLASVTKLFTAAAFMRLAEAGRVSLDAPVKSVLPEFSGSRPVMPAWESLESVVSPEATAATQAAVQAAGRPAASALAANSAPAPAPARAPQPNSEAAATKANIDRITFRILLGHSAGLPPSLPLWKAASPGRGGREDLLRAVLACPLCAKPGSRSIYSDLSLMTAGFAVERLAGTRLDAAIEDLITRPLGLSGTAFRPLEAGELEKAQGHAREAAPNAAASLAPGAPSGVAPTEFCPWRGRRLRGEVHDENAAAFQGVAGHAGLFSTARDLAAFGRAFLSPREGFLSVRSVAEMTSLQASECSLRRGLGFQLWSPNPDSASHQLGPCSFGHNGYTGTSLWMDPEPDLTVACLTNRVYYGRNPEGIARFRRALHAILLDM